MVNQITFIEMGIGILLCVGYFIYFISKTRKTKNFLSSMLWGILAFAVGRAITNMLNIGASALLENGIIPENKIVILLLTVLFTTIGTVFSAIFVLKTLKKRGKYEVGVTAEVVGFMAGSGYIASPINNNSMLVRLIQLFTNGLVVNQNPTQEQLGDIPISALETMKDFFASAQIGQFIMLAFIGIGLAVMTVLLYKFVDKVLESKKVAHLFGLPIAFTLLMNLTLEVPAGFIKSAIIVDILMVATIAAWIYIYKEYISKQNYE